MMVGTRSSSISQTSLVELMVQTTLKLIGCRCVCVVCVCVCVCVRAHVRACVCETTFLQIHANCRIRRVYFSDRLYSEDELPAEFKLYLPVQNKSPAKVIGLSSPPHNSQICSISTEAFGAGSTSCSNRSSVPVLATNPQLYIYHIHMPLTFKVHGTYCISL